MRQLAVDIIVLIFLILFVDKVPAPPALVPTRTAYNETEARQLLNLAAGAYASDPQPCIDRTFGPTAHMYQIYATTDQVCDVINSICSGYTMVNEQERRLYVVFRGTKTDKQLLVEGWNSLQPLRDFYGVGLANRYFLNALEVLWPNVVQALNDPRYRSFAITFTGHSLGAALASLAAMKTVIENIRQSNQIKLVTFGQPRVGNIDLATRHNQLLPYSFRVVHSDDIVPHSPACAKDHDAPGVSEDDKSKPCDPENTQRSYHHGIEIWYPTYMYPNSSYYECLGTPYGEDFNCSDMLTFKLSKNKQYVAAHRYYFEVKVPPFGKTGCDPRNPSGDGSSGDDDEPETPPAVAFAQNIHNNAKRAWDRMKTKINLIG